MKRTIPYWPVVFLSALLTLSGCKKESNSQTDNPAPLVTSVQINEKAYSVVTIGNQLWSAENYRGPGGSPYRTGDEKPEYGRYYTFDEAKAVPVPAGWRIPTLQDYKALAESQGVLFTGERATGQEALKKLVSKTNWRTMPGTNSSGFNAQPAGYIYQNSAPMDGDISEFWLADGNTVSIQESASGKGYTMMFYGTNGPGYRFTLRFVRNK
ncbi:FISUMP domain-containing protein [Larkinella insperata]|uniref:FISUMP domain-containing protein n=1 Tax=Larkinella insperata TaxID=332158 RepID=A0ABW3QBF5_9BACT|nr:FISUMP domain-containing protein [Larkinella insperata]